MVEFIEARLAEDDRIARRAGKELWIHYRSAEGPPDEVETLIVNDRHVDVGFFEDDPLRPAEAFHIGRHSPARVLRESEAKRRTLARHAPHRYGACPTCWRVTERSSTREDFPCPTLRDLALPYADHPDYLAEWRPVG